MVSFGESGHVDSVELLPFTDGEEEAEEEGEEEDEPEEGSTVTAGGRMTPDGDTSSTPSGGTSGKEFTPDLAFQESLMASVEEGKKSAQ